MLWGGLQDMHGLRAGSRSLQSSTNAVDTGPACYAESRSDAGRRRSGRRLMFDRRSREAQDGATSSTPNAGRRSRLFRGIRWHCLAGSSGILFKDSLRSCGHLLEPYALRRQQRAVLDPSARLAREKPRADAARITLRRASSVSVPPVPGAKQQVIWATCATWRCRRTKMAIKIRLTGFCFGASLIAPPYAPQ